MTARGRHRRITVRYVVRRPSQPNWHVRQAGVMTACVTWSAPTSAAGSWSASGGLNGLDYVEVSDDQLHAHRVLPRPRLPPDVTRANVRDRRRAADPRHPGRRRDHVPAWTIPDLDDCMSHAGPVRRLLDLPAVPGRTGPQGRPGDQPHARASTPAVPACGVLASRSTARPSSTARPADLPAAGLRTSPDLDYLAKDYASFRQLILDRLALIDAAAGPSGTSPDIGDRAGRAAGLRRRLPELLPGRGRHRGVPGHRPAAHLGAPARPAGRLPRCTRAATRAPWSACGPTST